MGWRFSREKRKKRNGATPCREEVVMRSDRRQKASGGFTLIELLLVVGILSVLASVVVVSVSGRRKQAMVGAARTAIRNIGMAARVYEVDTGRFPPSLDALVNDDGSPNWNGPYFEQKGVPVDPWNNEFQYKTTDNGFKIVCAGPDGNFGTEDDLTN